MGAWAFGVGLSGSYGHARHPSLADAAAEQPHSALSMRGTGRYGRLRLYPALRADRYVQAAGPTRTALSPRLGLNVQPFGGRPLRLKASVGRAFRLPTFNDRFWQPGGNPALRPERAWTADAGFFIQGRYGTAEVTAFLSRVRDQILWAPTRAGYWAPENARRVRTRGVEASWQGGYDRDGRRHRRRPFLHAHRRPRPLGRPSFQPAAPVRPSPRAQSLHAALGLGPVALDLGGRYTGRRLTDRGGTGALDPFFVFDGQARMERRFADVRVRLALAVENLAGRPVRHRRRLPHAAPPRPPAARGGVAIFE